VRAKWKISLFDWDGTLVDSNEMVYQCSVRTFEHFGVTPPTREQHLGKFTHPQSYYDHGIPKEFTRQDIDKVWERIVPNFSHLASLRKGAAEVLQECRNRGLMTAIVSDNTPQVILPTAERLGILELIDAVYAESCHKSIKLAKALLDVQAQDAFYVDDSHMGLTAAKNAGIWAIAIEGGFTGRERLLEAEPDHIISCLTELPAAIF
jgi:HAD superfamily hydrolase (TIGR01509 family)